jgi:hypothetical protein
MLAATRRLSHVLSSLSLLYGFDGSVCRSSLSFDILVCSPPAGFSSAGAAAKGQAFVSARLFNAPSTSSRSALSTSPHLSLAAPIQAPHRHVKIPVSFHLISQAKHRLHDRRLVSRAGGKHKRREGSLSPSPSTSTPHLSSTPVYPPLQLALLAPSSPVSSRPSRSGSSSLTTFLWPDFTSSLATLAMGFLGFQHFVSPFYRPSRSTLAFPSALTFLPSQGTFLLLLSFGLLLTSTITAPVTRIGLLKVRNRVELEIKERRG